MQDAPPPTALLDAVAAFLRDVAVPGLSGHAGYQARVAAGVLEIVSRELARAGPAAADERARLQALLGEDGDLATLNRRLAQEIEAGRIGLETPGLAEHLWAATLAKAAIDQPRYAGYLSAKGEG